MNYQQGAPALDRAKTSRLHGRSVNLCLAGLSFLLVLACAPTLAAGAPPEAAPPEAAPPTPNRILIAPSGAVGEAPMPPGSDAEAVGSRPANDSETIDAEPMPLPENEAEAEDEFYFTGADGIPRDESGAPLASPPVGQNAQADADVADEEVADTDPSALTDFRAELDAYGRWVDHPEYGTVWVPDESAVGTDFAPYVTRGRWRLNTSNAWVWDSSYPFGWVVFHYGRWAYVPSYGWSWFPGRRYAPAWVTFRVFPGGGSYIGWAPLSPAFYWRGGSAVFFGSAFASSWVFCPSRYVFSGSPRSHLVRERYRVRKLASGTRPLPLSRARRPISPATRALGAFGGNIPKTRISGDPRALAARRFRGRLGAASSGAGPQGRLQAASGMPSLVRASNQDRRATRLASGRVMPPTKTVASRVGRVASVSHATRSALPQTRFRSSTGRPARNSITASRAALRSWARQASTRRASANAGAPGAGRVAPIVSARPSNRGGNSSHRVNSSIVSAGRGASTVVRRSSARRSAQGPQIVRQRASSGRVATPAAATRVRGALRSGQSTGARPALKRAASRPASRARPATVRSLPAAAARVPRSAARVRPARSYRTSGGGRRGGSQR